MIHEAIIKHNIHKKKNYSGHSHVFLPRIKEGKVIEGTKVVRIYVKKKEPVSSLSADDVIPSKIIVDGEEYEIDVVEANPKALSLTQKIRPIQPGVSVGHFLVTAGSIGAILYYNGQPLILSNNHVLAYASSTQFKTADIGDAILQPGKYDGGNFSIQDAGDCVASLYAFIPIDTQNPNTVDCALGAPLTSDIVNPTYPSPINSVLNGFKLTINLNDQLQYVGRSSGYKQITVTDPSAQMQVNYEFYTATFDDVFVYTPSAIPGDSGSGTLDMSNNLAGLVFAGDTTNNVGLGVKISNILSEFSKLGITLDYKVPPQPTYDTNSVVLYAHSYSEIGTPTVTLEYQGNTITQPVLSDIICLLKNSIGQTVYIQSLNGVPIYPKQMNDITVAMFPLINVPAGTYKCITFATTVKNIPISQTYEFDVTITNPWFTQKPQTTIKKVV